MSCTRSQEYLAEAKANIDERVDARKSPIAGTAALKMIEDVDEIYAAKGKGFIHLDLRKESPSKETLLSALLGPTGNLRAPTLRVGRKLIVGFNREMYEQVVE